MRLAPDHVDLIRKSTQAVFGDRASVTLFGSRVDAQARGGDVDLLVTVPDPVEQPALLSARLASQISRALGGRRVDVVLKAPNLRSQPIHQIAEQSGIEL